MTIFITEQRPNLPIYSSRLGYTIRFEDGRYETDDPAEIAVLRRNRYVTDFGAVEQELTSPSELDDPLEPPADDATATTDDEAGGDVDRGSAD